MIRSVRRRNPSMTDKSSSGWHEVAAYLMSAVLYRNMEMP